jgi:predicted metal-dependent hydrolase
MQKVDPKHYTLEYADQLIEYEIHHKPSVTRRVHLAANPDGSLRVIAPRRMSRRAVHRTLQQRASRVSRFLAEAMARHQELPVLGYISGEDHLFLGQSYPLEVVERCGKRGSVQLVHGHIRIISPDTQAVVVSAKLFQWYRQQALQHFSSRLEVISQFAKWTGGQAPAMRLRKMKRTWGSCSAKGVITLNPHLVKAPAKCIDYVIAHELCHLEELNHGKAFYALQEQLFPGWREAKTQLKSRAHIYLHQ